MAAVHQGCERVCVQNASTGQQALLKAAVLMRLHEIPLHQCHSALALQQHWTSTMSLHILICEESELGQSKRTCLSVRYS